MAPYNEGTPTVERQADGLVYTVRHSYLLGRGPEGKLAVME
jgi:hypothetical protein